MEENEQLLMIIESRGHCPFSSVSVVTCHCCIADTFCKPEEDLNVIETRYINCLKLGLRRGIISQEEVFEVLL